MTVVPGQGIDFTALGRVLLLVLGSTSSRRVRLWRRAGSSTASSSGPSCGCAPTSRTSCTGCRCRYFDTKPRGELLSRVTNDIDNIQQTMQQTMSQLLNVAADARRRPDDDGADLAAARGGRAGVGAAVDRRHPAGGEALAAAVRRSSGGRPGGSTPTSRRSYTGHALVKVFGHQHEAEEVFEERNEALYQASFGAQFLSGIILPAVQFIGNLNYVFIAVIGGLRVASGAHVARRRPGVHPVLPAVQPAADPGRVDGQPAAVRRRVGRAGVRAARRRRAGRPTREPPATAGRHRAVGSRSSTCPSATSPTSR